MELDDDLKDALTYLDEARRKEAMAHLAEAQGNPLEMTLRRKAVMAEAEEAAAIRSAEQRRLQNRRMMEQAGAKPSTTLPSNTPATTA